MKPLVVLVGKNTSKTDRHRSISGRRLSGIALLVGPKLHSGPTIFYVSVTGKHVADLVG